MDSETGELPSSQSTPTPAASPKKRFRIVKLEERIAPGKGGKGSNLTCGHGCNSGGNTNQGCGSISGSSGSLF